MKRIVQWLVPKEKKIFEMLAEQSQAFLEAANELKKFLDDYSEIERVERKPRAYAIKKIVQKSEETGKKILESIGGSRTFIDREYLQQIAMILRDAAGLISLTASRFVVLGIERIDDHIIKIAGLVSSIASELNSSVLDLKKLKNMEEHCNKLHGLGEKAEGACQDALSDLFHFYKNSIDIIKNKEIYGLLESCVCKCRNLADVIEIIAAKNS